MSDYSHENLDSPEPSKSQEQDPSGMPQPAQGKSQTRRRFLKAGLVSVPMIVTLRSRPAFAQVSLGSAGIFYGRYELFLRDPNALPGATLPDGSINERNRWAPADQDGNELRDPTRRDPDGDIIEEGTRRPQIDDWSPDMPQLDNWSPD